MRDMSVQDGRIGCGNRLVAAGVALVCVAAMLVWGVPGIDPSLWEELAVVAGLRPPKAIFPGFWRCNRQNCRRSARSDRAWPSERHRGSNAGRGRTDSRRPGCRRSEGW